MAAMLLPPQNNESHFKAVYSRKMCYCVPLFVMLSASLRRTCVFQFFPCFKEIWKQRFSSKWNPWCCDNAVTPGPGAAEARGHAVKFRGRMARVGPHSSASLGRKRLHLKTPRLLMRGLKKCHVGSFICAEI